MFGIPVKAMMAKGVSDFKNQGHFVRPGRYPGNIYGGRFICKAAVGDQSLGKGENVATTLGSGYSVIFGR